MNDLSLNMTEARNIDFGPGDFMFWHEKPYHDYDRWCGVVAEIDQNDLVVKPMGVALPVRKIIGWHTRVSKPTQAEVLEYAPTRIERFLNYDFTDYLTRSIRARQVDSFNYEVAFLTTGGKPEDLIDHEIPIHGTGLGVLIGVYGEPCMCRPVKTTSNPFEIYRPAVGIETSIERSEKNVATLVGMMMPVGFSEIPVKGEPLEPRGDGLRANLSGYFFVEAPREALEYIQPVARFEASMGPA